MQMNIKLYGCQIQVFTHVIQSVTLLLKKHKSAITDHIAIEIQLTSSEEGKILDKDTKQLQRKIRDLDGLDQGYKITSIAQKNQAKIYIESNL